MKLLENTIKAWTILTFLNLIDLILYIEALRWPYVNKGWFARDWSPFTAVAFKMLMPVVVAICGLILVLKYENKSIPRVIWGLSFVYGLIIVWNVLQFIL